MDKTCFILLAMCCSIGGGFAEQSQTPSRPNIIIILVDDQGYYDLGCYGAEEVVTKNIDAMASTGIKYTDYYAAAPICSPSRAGLLTGCYPRRVGLATWVQRADSQIGLHQDERTIAELFHSYGYKTACIGKWHLGDHESFRPLQQGFDHYFGLLHNLDPVETMFFDEEGGVPLIRNDDVVKRPADPAELTRLYTDEAITFIKNNKSAPFFIYLPHTMLHNPLGVSPEFKNSSQWGEYGDAIQEMDFHVGRLMETLESEQLDQNTIVVYVSDNGRGPGRTEKQPIRGRKLSTYEGGIRVPCIVWGPGLGIKPQTSSAITHAMDLYPTLASMANISIPRDRIIDGRDMSPIWKGQCRDIAELQNHTALNADLINLRPWHPPREWASDISRDDYYNAFFYHGSQGALAAVRSRNLKLYLNPDLQVFDLEKDPGETKPIRDPRMKSLRGMAVLFQEEMSGYQRQAGKNALAHMGNDHVTKPDKADKLLVDAYKDIMYAKNEDKEVLLDLYKPKIANGKLPAILCIHGGGWKSGSKENMGRLAEKYAAHGFVAVSINYRLTDEAKFPANIHDCKAAVRWLRAHADQYGIDSSRIAATGHSAGGHLAALLAASYGIADLEGNGGHAEFSSQVQVAVPTGAQTNFLSQRIIDMSEDPQGNGLYPKYLGGPYSTHADLYKAASPITYLDKSDPPMLFISGENDNEDTRAVLFRAKMTELGIPSNYHMIRGAPHSFMKQQTFYDDAFRVSLNFLTIHLQE